MEERPEVREFSAERQLRLRRQERALKQITGTGAGSIADGSEALVVDPSGITNSEILQAINDLRQELRRANGAAQGAGPAPDMAEDESQDVRREIALMVRHIAQAKSEIASIKHPMAEDDRILAASNELDAIVQATEAATHQILEANECIEKELHKIGETHHNDEEVMLMVDKVAEKSIQILEASNFQDITGQRVTKVVKTIRFIEERILALIDIWGVEAFADLPVPEEGGPNDPDNLMSGPQLGNAGITQDEIDALFD